MDHYNNNFYGGYQPQAAGRPIYGGYQPQMQAQPQLTTNVELVTSLEEALFKSNMRNSDMLYLDQNKPVIYRIKVDMNGAKSYATLPYTLPNQADSTPATKADIQALMSILGEVTGRLDVLEKNKENKTMPKKKKAEEVDVDESNG